MTRANENFHVSPLTQAMVVDFAIELARQIQALAFEATRTSGMPLSDVQSVVVGVLIQRACVEANAAVKCDGVELSREDWLEMCGTAFDKVCELTTIGGAE